MTIEEGKTVLKTFDKVSSKYCGLPSPTELRALSARLRDAIADTCMILCLQEEKNSNANPA